MRPTHEQYFMEIAKVVATRSPCLHRQVGCVLVDKHNHILATGYNGPAKGTGHCVTCSRAVPGRDLYTCNAVHAEMNALLQCSNVFEIETAYITINPCQICTRLLLNTSCNGIIYGDIYTKESQDSFLHAWVGGGPRYSHWLK
jgi:dCMP deaminase